LLDAAPPPQRVLEIGCGGGANLAELKRRFPAIHATGVEIHPLAADAARHAERADDIVLADVLDTSAVNFPLASFDLIVLSHVLEHFAEPERVLARCNGWLSANGRMLIALPNMRHFSVITQLIFEGDFRYADDGILDRTHLRFYTRASAERMLKGHGLSIVKRRAEVAGRKARLLDAASLGLAREFTAFAYNFLAVRT
ncbi:MAG: class I SAM-dependent methyltransferase, partial [Ideonella sp.]